MVAGCLKGTKDGSVLESMFSHPLMIRSDPTDFDSFLCSDWSSVRRIKAGERCSLFFASGVFGKVFSFAAQVSLRQLPEALRVAFEMAPGPKQRFSSLAIFWRCMIGLAFCWQTLKLIVFDGLTPLRKR